MNGRKTGDAAIIAVLLAMTLILRLWTVMMIHTGVDERDYWYSAKSITQGYSYPYVNHRTVRWGVIVPVAAQQLITGAGANAYYVMPILNALAQTFLLYALGKRIFNRRVGAIAALFLAFFPYQIRSASQVRPEIFSITYISLFLLCFHSYLSSDVPKKSSVWLALSSVILFIAYLTKITTLFFMPAAFAVILIYRRKDFFRDSLLFGGILLFLFLIETLLYNLAGDYPLGQLSVIMSNHVADMETIDGFLDVFGRYLLKNLQLYWQIPIWLFFVASFFALRDGLPSRVKPSPAPADGRANAAWLSLFGLTFIFFVTFTPSSLRPLKMAEPFVNRYFSAALPCVFLVLAGYADRLLRALPAYRKTCRAFIPVGVTGIFLFCIVASSQAFPRRVREYVHSPLDREYHPFYLNRLYEGMINDAARADEPILAIDTNGGIDALYTASWYFLDDSFYVDGRPPAPSFSFEADGRRYASLGGNPLPADGEVLAVVRDPFRVRRVPASRVAGLDTEKFPEQE